MASLWFVVPAHGRAKLAQICLTQLRNTCDRLTARGIEASAVVVASDGNLEVARDLGFATVRRDNDYLSRKFNDGIQLACDPDYNPRPVDYVVPCGSDDWVDYRIFLNLPPNNALLAFRRAAFVNEDGTVMRSKDVDYQAGVGIRVYPRSMMARCGYRPADEDRKRACDTSILVNVSKTYGTGPKIIYGDLHQFQIVDWKSRDQQLNTYESVVTRFRRGTAELDPYETLASIYPAESIEAMRSHYGVRQLAAA